MTEIPESLKKAEAVLKDDLSKGALGKFRHDLDADLLDPKLANYRVELKQFAEQQLVASGKSKSDVVEPPLYLAQGPVRPGQITGHPTWGTIAPVAKKRIEQEAIKRQNEDHKSAGQELPASGNSPEEQARAKTGAAAKVRADSSRKDNVDELHRSELGPLDASIRIWPAPVLAEVSSRLVNRYHWEAAKDVLHQRGPLDNEIAQAQQQKAKLKPDDPKYLALQEKIETYQSLKQLEQLQHPETLDAEIACEKYRLGGMKEHTREYDQSVKRLESYVALKKLQKSIDAVHKTIADETTQFESAQILTPEYLRLRERLESYEKLQLGKEKTADQREIAKQEMLRLNDGKSAFTDEEVIGFLELEKTEQQYYSTIRNAKDGSVQLRSDTDKDWTKRGREALTGDRLGGAMRIGRGMIGSGVAVGVDYWASSYFDFKKHDVLASFMAPSTLEVMAVGATSTLPVPKFVPGAGGPLYARIGARLLYEGGVDLSAKLVAFSYHQITDPAVEGRHLETAKQALISDQQNKKPESMDAAINAWKRLGDHDNQIQQALNDTVSQYGTTDQVKLEQTRRNAVALYAAFGENWLAQGTRVGVDQFSSTQLIKPIKPHFIFAGRNFDFGGVALENLNAARNVLTELKIPPADLVAKRIYSSQSKSEMSKILAPHKDLPAIFDELKTMVKKNDPDAKWLSDWLATRVTDRKILLLAEERAAMAAKAAGHKFVPTYNQYVLAKVYQDKAMLDLAYVANDQNPQAHLKSAHDELKEAQRLGWTGREINVNVGGKAVKTKRESDLPEIIKIYHGLHGTVDW